MASTSQTATYIKGIQLTDAQDTSTDNQTVYDAFHAPRFRYLLELLDTCLPPEATRICDVAPSSLTDRLRAHTSCRVDTIGLQASSVGADSSHYQVDLLAPEPLPADVAPYDAIVFSEVLEHLIKPPVETLRYLRGLLAPGGLLFLQTPNAVSLPKRVKMLCGSNPYELLRNEPDNPGHIREYTASELRQFLEDSDYDVLDVHFRFYFDARYASTHLTGRRPAWMARLKNSLYPHLPATWRESITVVARARSLAPDPLLLQH